MIILLTDIDMSKVTPENRRHIQDNYCYISPSILNLTDSKIKFEFCLWNLTINL